MLGLQAAKTELGVRIGWTELAYKVLLAPVTFIGEIRSITFIGHRLKMSREILMERLRSQLAERDRTIGHMTASRDRWKAGQLARSSEVVQLRDALLRIAMAWDAGTAEELAETINKGKAALEPGPTGGDDERWSLSDGGHAGKGLSNA